ncbi:MAG TPA: oligosaccharide flippase family protein, partial [Myxococcota bacterium]|nr:oligosaccharide flippase family protein [Myxococcota bacterium]
MSTGPDKRSHQRHMLAATSVTGLASVGNIALSVIRVKVIALLVGPAGIGLLGLYLRFTTLVATLSGLGLSQSGVREVAAARDPEELAKTRRALMSASLILGLIAAAIVLIFKRPIARAIFEDTTRSDEVAWLGLAVLMTGLATAQTAYLQGLRKIKQAALVTVGGALVGSLVGIAFVVALGADGLVALVIASPTGGALVAWLFARRVRREAEPTQTA